MMLSAVGWHSGSRTSRWWLHDGMMVLVNVGPDLLLSLVRELDHRLKKRN